MATIDSKFTVKKSLKDIKKLEDEIAEQKIRCEHCGHTMVMPFTERKICSWCGYWVYKDEKTKFKFKMKEELNKK